jgi:class 3 adenylate cyclase/HEAT repeat protein
MNASPPTKNPSQAAIAKETRITVLTLLKYFYDEQIFALLVKDFYNSDPEVSLAAINASASLGNEVAVPHLYRMLEHGKTAQKLAAIQALAAINAPSSIDRLAKYFSIMPAAEVRREILKAINRISALHPRARELNRAVLVDPAMARDYYELTLGGLLEAGELEPVRSHLLRATPEVQRVLFYKLLSAESAEASGFLEAFQDKTGQFDPNTLGCYLCAYELKTVNPQTGFVIDLLVASDPRATASFLISLSNYNGRIPNPGRVFRLLLKLPYVDQEAETLTGTFLTKLVAEIRSHSPLLINEFTFTTSANLEAVFTKVKKQHLSLKGIKEREALLAVVLAKLLEQHSTPELLAEVQSHFRVDDGDADSLIARIKEALTPAPEDDQNRLEACLRLFASSDRLVRLNVSHTLARANPTTPALLRRLNRLIRVAGILEVRPSAKKLLEVLTFAREERVSFLEESAVVTLCQLLNRAAIEQAKTVLAEPAKYPHSLHGFIRGARFVPARIFVPSLLKLLPQSGLPPKTRELIIDSLKAMDLSESKGILPPLIRALRLPGLDRNRLLDLSTIIAQYGDSEVVPPLLELTSGETPIAPVAVRTLRNLARRERSLPLDVLTNRLYLLLEHKLKVVRIEALLSLIALQDDYAVQILDDYVHAKDEEALVQILASLDRPISHETIAFLLKLLHVDNPAVHRELREVLPEFCQGGEAEEIRSALLDLLKEKGSPAAAPLEPSEQPAGLLEHAKLEFKFRRENAQVLTVFFTDMVGFTAKSSSADASTLFRLIKAFEDISLPEIAGLRGTLIKKMGDGLLAVFKHPLNAAVASLRIQKKIREYNQLRTESEKFSVRIGLNTGLVIRKEGDVYGDTVNVASRMQSSATPGDVLLTQSTHDEIKDFVRCTRLGDLQLKGKSEPVTAYSAVEVLIDDSRLMADTREGAPAAATAAPGAKGLANLKESMFEPDFRVPAAAAGMEERLTRTLQGLFKDFAKAAEALTKDYHEEYEFKRYLHQKWQELFRR